MTRLDGVCPAATSVRLLQTPDAKPQSYRLSINGSSITIEHADDAGLRYAESTLTQLRDQYGDAVPCMVIEDWPAFPTRGYMLDVSRCRVPTMEHLESLVRTLSELRFNHLQLYTEHTFAYREHEDAWSGSSPITHEDVRQLDNLCTDAGIELAANQNCFGHLAHWLRLPAYQHLAETHGEFEFYGTRRQGPFSLCPTDPGSLSLVNSWLSELRPLFSGGLVNIGCDETADVGTGRSANAVRENGLGVYAAFVSKVAEHAIQEGWRPMFWADVALSSPEALSMLPDELLSLAWGYEPDSPFEQWSETLNRHGRDWWVCPGTCGWRTFAGRTQERQGHLEAAVRAGRAGKASGVLVTDWGDLGHRQTHPVSLRALADAAEASWSGEHAKADLDAADRVLFGPGSSGVSDWLDQLGSADSELRSGWHADGTPLRNASATFEVLHPASERSHPPHDTNRWQNCLDRVQELASRVPVTGEDLLNHELTHAADCSHLGASTGFNIASGAKLPIDAELLEHLIASHNELWPTRSRSGGFDDSAAYWTVLRERAE